MNISDLKVGLTFQQYYNENNLSNIGYCEVKGIVDNNVIVLFCKKEATNFSEYKEFYKMIYVVDFEYNAKHNAYIEI